jgi:hypothetical protein
MTDAVMPFLLPLLDLALAMLRVALVAAHITGVS